MNVSADLLGGVKASVNGSITASIGALAREAQSALLKEITSPLAAILQEAHASFRYVVNIDGVNVGAFTECTLPTLELDTQVIKEGGQNYFVHELPGQRKSARLTLKNGVGKNSLMDWCVKTFAESFERKAMELILNDARGTSPICTWRIENAYPIKWTGPQLQAESTSIAIQTVEFVCGEVTMVIGDAVID